MAIMRGNMTDIPSNGEAQTEQIGAILGQRIQVGDFICLQGDLGAGKTAFTRGVAAGWGTLVRVTSPSFTIINQYPRSRDGVPLYHLDFYRLNTPSEIVTTGVEDLFEEDAAFVIEWPERAKGFLPKDRLNVIIRASAEKKRVIRFDPVGDRANEIAKIVRNVITRRQ